MEKAWIYNFRLRAASALIFLGGLSVYADEVADVQSVIVDVEVPIVSDNLAAAKEAARKLAFEKALDQVLPPDFPARTDKIKAAGRSIKSFQVIEEKQEGSLLKQKFRCDVMKPASKPVETPNVEGVAAPEKPAEQTAVFEIAWLPDEVQFNSVELLKFVSEKMGAPASSVRLGRGNIVLTIAIKSTLDETQRSLAEFVGRRGMVKLIRRDEARPPDALPAEVPTAPTPSGSSTPDLLATPSAPTPTAAPEPTAMPAPSGVPENPALPKVEAAPVPEASPPSTVTPLAPTATVTPPVAPSVPTPTPSVVPGPDLMKP